MKRTNSQLIKVDIHMFAGEKHNPNMSNMLTVNSQNSNLGTEYFVQHGIVVWGYMNQNLMLLYYTYIQSS